MQRKLTAAFVLLLSGAIAQDRKSNFCGTWNLVSRPGTASAKVTDRIEQTDSTLAITRISVRSSGTIVYPTDGREATEQIGRRKIKRSGLWEGDKLVLESKSMWRLKERTNREVLSLSDDGKTMRRTLHLIGAKRTPDQEFAFERISP